MPDERHSARPPRPRDVRMRGFASRATVAEALAWMDAQTIVLEPERVPLSAAHGRVLADAVAAAIDVPAFDRSAMDGFALRGDETGGAGEYNPLTFEIIGEALPGQPFAGEVRPGTAVRIMTGAPLPCGADAVLPAEYAAERGGTMAATAAIPPGKNIGRRGEDIGAGSVVLSAGRRLRPQDLGALASVGIADVDVIRRPRVRLVITGNELAAPGEPLRPFQIYESNSWMLGALVARDGGELESVRHVADVREEISAALTAPGADVLLVSGGSSVGREDHAPSIIAEHGELAIHGIAMRPSSPAGVGRLAGAAHPQGGPQGRERPPDAQARSALVFLLPGNPVSCLCAYDFFAGRAIRGLGGRRSDWPYQRVRATVRRKLVSAIGRVDYCRVRIERGEVEPLALSGAAILSSTTRADGFVIVPADREGYGPGAEIDVWLYDILGETGAG